jgi:hypothetical protein
MADVAYKAIGTVDNTLSSGVMNPALPSGWAAGDFALAYIYGISSASATIAFPAGWTEIVDVYTASPYLHIGLAWRFLQAGDGAPAITVSGSPTLFTARVITYSNVNTTTPIHIAAVTANIATDEIAAYTADITGVTTTVNGAMAIFIYGAYTDNAARTWSSSTGFTERGDNANDDGTKPPLATSLGISEKAMATAGATGTLTATLGGPIYGGKSITLALLAVPSSFIKTVDSLAKASVKTVNGLAKASMKTWNGLT